VADVFAQGVVVTAMHSHARRDEDFGVNSMASRTARILVSVLSLAHAR
jgi:hypothetical protein